MCGLPRPANMFSRLLSAICWLHILRFAATAPTEQHPLIELPRFKGDVEAPDASHSQKLHGRFLHITGWTACRHLPVTGLH